MTCTAKCRKPAPSQAHCTSCHRTFGGVKGFDEHRKDGQCLDPATRRMTEVDGIWRRDVGKPPPEGWQKP